MPIIKREFINDRWCKQYDELVKYVKEFDHARVPVAFAENPSLGRWVNTQRKYYKNYTDGKLSRRLSKEQIRLLNRIGFEWKMRPRNFSWDRRFDELLDYVEKFGNARVPRSFADNPALGSWVRTQRQNYRMIHAGKLLCCLQGTKERIRLLNSIGFEWNVYKKR